MSYLKGFALFYHIPYTYGMHMSLEIYLKEKTRKMKNTYNKDKASLIILLVKRWRFMNLIAPEIRL